MDEEVAIQTIFLSLLYLLVLHASTIHTNNSRHEKIQVHCLAYPEVGTKKGAPGICVRCMRRYGSV